MADWSLAELQFIISDYFAMLQKEIAGINYNKSEHRRLLASRIPDRSGSIEYKHQNISAVLIKIGLPYIKGYKPLPHYQQLLEQEVLVFISANPQMEISFDLFAGQNIVESPSGILYQDWKEEPPVSDKALMSEPPPEYSKVVKKNYLEIEQRNQSIGEAGEKLVLEFEKWKLKQAGVPELLKEVFWVSKELGDGAGYDILSKTPGGEDMYIEVKSTTLGKDTPIFFSKRENDFSRRMDKYFHLYRVFDLRKEPKMFSLNGQFSKYCSTEAIQFKGYF